MQSDLLVDAQFGGRGPGFNTANLQFDQDIVDAYEIGMKYTHRYFTLNVAAFRQLFENFQLNTFNGLNFVVENVNSCSEDLGGADQDNNPRTGACTGDVRAGVKSVGFELEAFTRPLRDLSVNAGVVMANTKYRDNLVGADGRIKDKFEGSVSAGELQNAVRRELIR